MFITLLREYLSKNYDSLGEMLRVLIERNAVLERENEKLTSDLRSLQARVNDSSPVSHYSESTDEGGQKAGVRLANATNS
jgi:hypothetical protein